MKKKHAFLVTLSLIFALAVVTLCALAGCALFGNLGGSGNDNLGEVLGVAALFLDEHGKPIANQSLVTITYGQYVDMESKVQVRAVQKAGKYTVLNQKSGKTNGYTLEITFSNSVSGQLTLDKYPNVYQWGTYTFKYSYGGYSDTLRVVVERAQFDAYDCQLVVYDQTYLENFRSPYVANLPDNDDVKVEIFYKSYADGQNAWLPWTFSDNDINTEFLPGGSTDVKAVISAPNYFETELNGGFRVNKYSLKGNLTLVQNSLELEYIPQNFADEKASLSRYNTLLNRQAGVTFNGQPIEGEWEFVDGSPVPELGVTNFKVRFVNETSDLYVDEEHEFELTINFQKFKVAIPTIRDEYTSILHVGNYMPGGCDFHVDDQERYSLYYYDKHLVDVNYEMQYNPGTYPCTLALADKNHTQWADGTTADIETTWTLRRGSALNHNLCFSRSNAKELDTVFYKTEWNADKQAYCLDSVMNATDGNDLVLNAYLPKNGANGYYRLDVYFSVEVDEQYQSWIDYIYLCRLTDVGRANADESGYVTITGKLVFSQERFITYPITEVLFTMRIKLAQ